jgi:hypothetical protein
VAVDAAAAAALPPGCRHGRDRLWSTPGAHCPRLVGPGRHHSATHPVIRPPSPPRARPALLSSLSEPPSCLWHCLPRVSQGTNDTKIATGIDWFASRRHAVTTASPLTHKLGPNGTLVDLPVGGGTTSSFTTASVFKALRAKGVRVLPILYNDESYGITLLPKLRQLFADPHPFISQLAALAEEVSVLSCCCLLSCGRRVLLPTAMLRLQIALSVLGPPSAPR